ncbi:unnamed protein product [Toxocara canis]|uniref:BTB domain-containing protein n=1 Tax=Toxocara canis TaxID=6265 RepID=A0A183TXZ6_TOXCA|nr:unnamed protein product [Toxocara canis]
MIDIILSLWLNESYKGVLYFQKMVISGGSHSCVLVNDSEELRADCDSLLSSSECSVFDKLTRIRRQNEGCNIFFALGNDRVRFAAHRLILAMASEVFYRNFYGSVQSEAPENVLTDGELWELLHYEADDTHRLRSFSASFGPYSGSVKRTPLKSVYFDDTVIRMFFFEEQHLLARKKYYLCVNLINVEGRKMRRNIGYVGNSIVEIGGGNSVKFTFDAFGGNGFFPELYFRSALF